MAQQGLHRMDNDEAGGGDDTILPAQFWTALADPRIEPEKRLMVAVLEDAVSLVVGRGGCGGDDPRAAVREALRWFASDCRATPFAFASICDVLDLDVDRLREAIHAAPHHRQLFRRPRLQAGRGRHQVRSGERSRRRAA
jgi:hypothetical protein